MQKAAGSHSAGVELEEIPLSEVQLSYVSKISTTYNQYFVFTAVLRSKELRSSPCISLCVCVYVCMSVH